MTGLVAIVAALVVYRLTMLVVADKITEPIRDRIIDRFVHPAHDVSVNPSNSRLTGQFPYVAKCRCGLSWAGDEWSDVVADANQHVRERRGEMTAGPRWLILLDCPWCASFWIAGPVVWSAWCFSDRSWWFIPAGMLAGSAVTGILATFAKPES